MQVWICVTIVFQHFRQMDGYSVSSVHFKSLLLASVFASHFTVYLLCYFQVNTFYCSFISLYVTLIQLSLFIKGDLTRDAFYSTKKLRQRQIYTNCTTADVDTSQILAVLSPDTVSICRLSGLTQTCTTSTHRITSYWHTDIHNQTITTVCRSS